MIKDTKTWQNDTRRLKKALHANIFRLIFAGYQSVDGLFLFEAFLKEAFPDRPFHFLKLEGLTYEQIIDTLMQIEEGLVFIPDFEYILKRDDLRVAINQRRDMIGQKKYALIACMPLFYLQKMPKLLPDWWSVRTLVFDIWQAELESKTTTSSSSDEKDPTQQLLYLKEEEEKKTGWEKKKLKENIEPKKT